MNSRSLRDQRGVALITVLLVMVIAIAAVAHAITRNRIAISRTSAILANTQLAEFVTGAEVWARVALEKDYLADREAAPASDSAEEPWAQRQLEFNPSNGKIRIHIKDLHACFNVNNLTAVGADAAPQLDIFRRLVSNLGVKAELVPAIQDWLDQGDTPQVSGTEDDGYLGMELAHRTPDTLITDVSELSAVQDMDAEEWDKLRPYVCALPEAGTAINVNFAPQELLQALYPQANVAQLVSSRDSGNVFTDRAQLAEFGITGSGGELAFNSQYFVAHIAVQLGTEHRQYWESVLQLDQTSGQARVLQRQRREFTGDFLQELLGD